MWGLKKVVFEDDDWRVVGKLTENFGASLAAIHGGLIQACAGLALLKASDISDHKTAIRQDWIVDENHKPTAPANVQWFSIINVVSYSIKGWSRSNNVLILAKWQSWNVKGQVYWEHRRRTTSNASVLSTLHESTGRKWSFLTRKHFLIQKYMFIHFMAHTTHVSQITAWHSFHKQTKKLHELSGKYAE